MCLAFILIEFLTPIASALEYRAGAAAWIALLIGWLAIVTYGMVLMAP